MPIKITMPALSPTMEKGNLTKWHKKEGDKVESGEAIADIETDKATMEVEAADEGVIGKIIVPEGTKDVKVNAVIALLLEEGEDKSTLDSVDLGQEVVEKKEEPTKQASAQPKFETKSKAEPKEVKQTNVPASPLAKRISEQSSVDLSHVTATGPHGKVVKNDVLSHIKRGGANMALNAGVINRASPEFSDLPVSTIRGISAERLLESKQQIPHFYLSLDCDITKMLEMRKEINSATDPEKPAWKISVNDLVIKAVATALKLVPDANVAWGDGKMIQYNNVDISVAVAIKDGLITPIVKNADQKSIFTISSEMKELAKKARANALKPSEFQGGSATISNLGMYGIKQFNAIINPPQSCIFAIGAAQQVPSIVEGEIHVTNIMNVTLSCDHRAVDGAVGASLLKILKEYIENPSRLLI